VSSDRRSWPAGFLWGVSTSAHQYDGNNVASDYWEIEHMDLPIFAEPSGDALNSYWLWPQDMALAAKLGFTGYRFSVEWARIEPVPGCFSIAERNRYRAMIDYCRELGLEPVVTLHHITHPAWFTRNGGWTAADAVDRFAAYVAFVAPAMQGVRWVTTINEPNILATLGPASRVLTAQDPAALYRSMSATKAGSGGGVLGAATLSEPADEVVAALTRAHIAAKAVLKDSTSDAVGWTVAAQAFEMVPGFEAAWNHHSGSGRTVSSRFRKTTTGSVSSPTRLKGLVRMVQPVPGQARKRLSRGGSFGPTRSASPSDMPPRSPRACPSSLPKTASLLPTTPAELPTLMARSRPCMGPSTTGSTSAVLPLVVHR